MVALRERAARIRLRVGAGDESGCDAARTEVARRAGRGEEERRARCARRVVRACRDPGGARRLRRRAGVRRRLASRFRRRLQCSRRPWRPSPATCCCRCRGRGRGPSSRSVCRPNRGSPARSDGPRPSVVVVGVVAGCDSSVVPPEVTGLAGLEGDGNAGARRARRGAGRRAILPAATSPRRSALDLPSGSLVSISLTGCRRSLTSPWRGGPWPPLHIVQG